jgi:hypothetical protein
MGDVQCAGRHERSGVARTFLSTLRSDATEDGSADSREWQAELRVPVPCSRVPEKFFWLDYVGFGWIRLEFAPEKPGLGGRKTLVKLPPNFPRPPADFAGLGRVQNFKGLTWSDLV